MRVLYQKIIIKKIKNPCVSIVMRSLQYVPFSCLKNGRLEATSKSKDTNSRYFDAFDCPALQISVSSSRVKFVCIVYKLTTVGFSIYSQPLDQLLS